MPDLCVPVLCEVPLELSKRCQPSGRAWQKHHWIRLLYGSHDKKLVLAIKAFASRPRVFRLMVFVDRRNWRPIRFAKRQKARNSKWIALYQVWTIKELLRVRGWSIEVSEKTKTYFIYTACNLEIFPIQFTVNHSCKVDDNVELKIYIIKYFSTPI